MRRRAGRKKASVRRTKARAADVLSTARPAGRVKSKWRKRYRRLIESRNFLLARKGDLAKDATEETPAFSMHMADAGTDTFDRDLALSMMSSEQEALYEIDQALDRIQKGTYGICELTGKPIEAKRLEAIPWTRFSAAAEAQLERQGGVTRARLRPREISKKAASEMEEEL